MKTRISHKAKQLASSLLVVLAICTVFSLGIAGYLSLVEQQNTLSYRSQSWNVAIAVVEAGIEEGLQQLNSTTGPLNVNGWTRSSTNSNLYTRSQTLADGNSYTVALDVSSSSAPIIIARASIVLPTVAVNSTPVFFAAVNVSQAQTDPEAVTRAVRVRCSRNNPFTAALVAKHVIDLKGNGVYTDSFDSGDTNKSVNGHYTLAKYSGDLGDIASNGGITDSVSVQNANIYGTVHTGPNCPVAIGSQGGVGPHGSQVGDIPTAVALGYILQDANFTFPDTRLPSLAGLFTPPSGTVIAPSYSFSTNAVTSSTFPSPVPAGGVLTNVTYTTSSTLPSPVPAGTTTNIVANTVSTVPSPVPAGTITNIITTNVTTTTYPAAGTYVGGVTTNPGKNKNFPDTYTYNKITGYTYTYNSYTYTCRTCTYTYDLTQTTVTYTTNYYDHIVYGSTTNYALDTTDNYYIAGPNACLILPNGLTANLSFTIANGANVLIYSGSTSVTVSGNQVINPNGYAGSFIVYCAPSVTSFTLNGNGEFTGVLVAPNANLTMNGGGNANNDFIGCLMVNNVRMNGHFSFHWDEALGRRTGNSRYLITSWDEIDPKGL